MKTCVLIAPNDRYNYGDLLFSYVLRAKIGDLYDKIINIATIDADLSLVGGDRVHSIKRMQKLTGKDHYDVIVAGGHSLFCPWPFVLYCLDDKYRWLSKLNILLSKFLGQKKSMSVTNRISALVFGAKTRYPYSIGKFEMKGIRKIIYNSVDGNIDDQLEPSDKRLLSSVDYLSVRNKKTHTLLTDNGLNAIAYPDSAIQISRLFPVESLMDKVSIKHEYFESPYIVFQINRELGESYFTEIITNLKNILNNHDLKVYLCPIGFAKGHDDLIVLDKIHKAINNDNLYIFDNLNIWDIMSLIANSKGFIGSSLHGCITAMSYCRPHLGINVRKTQCYIRDWGLGDNFCADSRNFYSAFSNIVNCKPEILEENLNYQLTKSDESFRKIREQLS